MEISIIDLYVCNFRKFKSLHVSCMTNNWILQKCLHKGPSGNSTFTFTLLFHCGVYLIPLGLWSKYDIDGHYSRFAARILVNLCKIWGHVAMLHTVVVFSMQSFHLYLAYNVIHLINETCSHEWLLYYAEKNVT